jgi:phospholipase C
MTKKYLWAVQTRLSRRRALQMLGGLAGAAAVGCGDERPGGGSASDGSSTGSTSGEPDTGSTSGEPGSSTSGTTDLPTTSDGTFGETQGTTGEPGSSTGDATTGEPVDECAAGDLTPEQLLAGVEHVVVLVMENRSFDHYFGALKLVEGKPVDGLSSDESNPSFGLGTVSVYKSDEFHPKDPPHEWDEVHLQFNLGDLNGFVAENEKKNPGFAEQVMGYHVREQLPVTYGLADNFALCERYFCSVLGPTWPNRYYLNACSSGGEKSNFPSPFVKTLYHACDEAGITSRIYFTDVPWVAGAFPLVPTVWGKLADDVGGFSLDSLTNPNTLERFFDDAASGDLPNFTVIDPGFTSNDDHPEHSPELGQILIGAVYKALAESPIWDKVLLVITYDEHGGFYDHVAPHPTIDEDPEFAHLGFRVPTLVVGPRVRRGCVIQTELEHCSIGKTLMTRWGIAPLNERMAQANDFSSCINPALVDDPQPGPPIPLVDVSISAITARVGRTTSQKELFEQTGTVIDEAFRQKQLDTTMRLLARAEKLGVARVRP